MSTFAPYKVVSALPTPLVANAMYAVRVGTGFDLYLVDSSGANAFKVNGGDSGMSYLTTIYGDAEAYAFVLNTQGLTTSQLNTWLNSQTRIDQFTTLLNSHVTLSSTLNDGVFWLAVAASPTAMTAVAASSTAMMVVASPTAMTAVVASSTAMTAVAASTTAMTAVAASTTAMTAVAASSTAMTAVAASAVALSVIAKSASGATSIELALQSYRAAIISTLDAATTLFGKVTTNVGNGAGTFDAGANTNTFYIPTSCSDDGDTAFNVQSPLRSYAQVVSIAAHSGSVAVSTGLTLRGVRVYGTGSSVGNVTFSVYTAV